MNNIILSIIIPCYNCENYIEKTLMSLRNGINKEINNKIEIIFIDDGSTDNSLNIVYSFAEKTDLNINVVKQKNKGVSQARNYGLSLANGKYIFFLDSDDYVEKDFFYEIFKRINKIKFDVLLFGFNKVNDSGILWSYKEQYVYNNGVDNGEDILLKYFNQEIGISLWSMIIRKDIIFNNHIKFRVDCFYAEDIEFFSRVLLNSKLVYTIPKEIFNYYLRKDSAIASFNEKRFTGINAIYYLKNFVAKSNIKNKENLLILINNIIVKEIVYLYFAYVYYSNKNQRNKYNMRKIKNIVKENKSLIKNFKKESKADESLEIYIKALLIAPNFFTNVFLIRRYIKNYINNRRRK